MITVNMHEAKTHLSRLVAGAVKGDSFIIARAGKPLVKVTPVKTVKSPKKTRIGFLEGKIKIPNDFDIMYADEIADMFEGQLD